MATKDGILNGGGRKNKPKRDNLGQFMSLDNNGNGNGNGNGKNRKNGKDGNKGVTCGWINVRDYNTTEDNEDKHRKVKAVYTWYDSFVRGFPKDVVSRLSSDPASKYVAWEVQSVLAQLKNVYARAEGYLKDAESQKKRLDSLNPPPSLKDANNDMVFTENNPLIEQLFRIDKLKYANLNLLSILSGINTDKLRTFAERWVQRTPEYRTQRVTRLFVGLQYDYMYDVFFAHYGYEGAVSPPIMSVRFTLPVKSGNINDDCEGYVYEQVQSEVKHLITIVAPISEGDNLWNLFNARPLTYRRPRSTRSNKNSSLNDPMAPSYIGGQQSKPKSKKTPPK